MNNSIGPKKKEGWKFYWLNSGLIFVLGLLLSLVGGYEELKQLNGFQHLTLAAAIQTCIGFCLMALGVALHLAIRWMDNRRRLNPSPASSD